MNHSALKVIVMKNNAPATTQISVGVCVPLKVSPETNNVRVRQAIQSRQAIQAREITKYCLIPVQTEYCCRLKNKD